MRHYHTFNPFNTKSLLRWLALAIASVVALLVTALAMGGCKSHTHTAEAVVVGIVGDGVWVKHSTYFRLRNKERIWRQGYFGPVGDTVRLVGGADLERACDLGGCR